MLRPDDSEKRARPGSWASHLVQLVAGLIAPAPRQHADQWADANRVVARGKANPGPWRSSRSAYVIGPSRGIGDPRFRRTFVCMFAQGGKSSAWINAVGHRLDTRPTPVLVVAPTRNDAEGTISPKLDELISHSPSLTAKVTGKQGKRLKSLAGVTVRLAWSHSPTEISGDDAGLVIADDIDRAARNVGGESSLIAMCDARHSSFEDGTTAAISTPTEGNVDTYTDERTGLEHWAIAPADALPSPIWSVWQIGTRHEYAWPCPHCREWHVPRLKLLTWNTELDPVRQAKQLEASACLPCPHCGAAISSAERGWMVSHGVYVCPGQRPLPLEDEDEQAHVADYTGEEPPELHRGGRNVHAVDFGAYEAPIALETDDLSFWCSGLCNFAVRHTFGSQARRLAQAQATREPETIQGVINLNFGECVRFRGEAPPWHAVLAKRGDYPSGTVPEAGELLILTVDKQDNRLEWVARVWAQSSESWLCEHGAIVGDTSKPGPWRDLDTLLEVGIDGVEFGLVLVDSGDDPDPVYAWTKQHAGLAWPTKGSGDDAAAVWKYSPLDKKPSGKTDRQGTVLITVRSGLFKSWVHARVEWPEGEAGDWHLPGDIDAAYCKEIVAESRFVTPAGKVVWKEHGPNHKLDCEALQALGYRVAINRGLFRAAIRRRRLGVEAQTTTERVLAPAARPKPASDPYL